MNCTRRYYHRRAFILLARPVDVLNPAAIGNGEQRQLLSRGLIFTTSASLDLRPWN
jgi:hypothetical protein